MLASQHYSEASCLRRSQETKAMSEFGNFVAFPSLGFPMGFCNSTSPSSIVNLHNWFLLTNNLFYLRFHFYHLDVIHSPLPYTLCSLQSFLPCFLSCQSGVFHSHTLYGCAMCQRSKLVSFPGATLAT